MFQTQLPFDPVPDEFWKLICEQQKPASELDAVNPLSPPLTPGHNNKHFPTNFLTPSPDNFSSSSVVDPTRSSSSSSSTTTHVSTHPTKSGSVHIPSEVSGLHSNFNIPCFIPADIKGDLDTHEVKDSQNSYLSLTLQNLWQDRHFSSNESHIHSLPSPVSSPEESDQTIQTLIEAFTASHSPAPSPLHHHQSQQEQSYFQYSPHHLQQYHHYLNQPKSYSQNTPQNNAEKLESICSFRKLTEKELFVDTPSSHVDHTTPFQIHLNNQNNSSLNRCDSDSSKVAGSDVKDIVNLDSTTVHYKHLRQPGPKRLNFDMNRTDVTTDINNNNNNNNNNSSNHNFQSTVFTKNNDSHENIPEIPLSLLMSSCEEPPFDMSIGDHSDTLACLDGRTFVFPSYSELSAIVSDVSMIDSGSNSREYDFTYLKDVDIDELEHISDCIMNSATSDPSDLPSIHELDLYPSSSTGSPSGDDFSEGDYGESQHFQTLEVNSNFTNPIFNNPAHLVENDQPDSPSTSDEGFVDCVPSSLDKDLPLGGKSLPFDGKFPETEESEISSGAESNKKPRKQQSSLSKLKRKLAASPPGERRKPGRKPGQVSNVLHLWEFMRDLLRDPKFNGCIIEWISQIEGVFRVLNSAEVARLWGEKKNNKKAMTYEKLSRSLRYSRLEGYFDNLPKDKNYPKKLCFKFGPKSKDWSLTS